MKEGGIYVLEQILVELNDGVCGSSTVSSLDLVPVSVTERQKHVQQIGL